MTQGTLRTLTTTVALALCLGASGCQLIKKIRNRGEDSGTRPSPNTILNDGGGALPTIGLPNPTVAPLPTQPMMVPPTPTPEPTTDVPSADADAGTGSNAPADAGSGIAVVDAGGIPPGLNPRDSRRYIRNYCKEHPGRIHPVTHVQCPI